MKRSKAIGLISIGFIAGIAFIISCGGGGSKVLAEITSVLGIEERLDNIDYTLQEIRDALVETSTASHISTTITVATDEAITPGGTYSYGPISLSGISSLKYLWFTDEYVNDIALWYRCTYGGLTDVWKTAGHNVGTIGTLDITMVSSIELEIRVDAQAAATHTVSMLLELYE